MTVLAPLGRTTHQEGSDVEVPEELRYTVDHEWLRGESEEAVVGITAYAADELGDIVFVELPEVGRRLAAAEAFGVIESVKTASDLYAPAAGEVVAVNESLAASPELVNSDPYGAGWMVRLRLDDSAAGDDLLDAAAYRARLEG
jgi:glycine cleavage system H protein